MNPDSLSQPNITTRVLKRRKPLQAMIREKMWLLKKGQTEETLLL